MWSFRRLASELVTDHSLIVLQSFSMGRGPGATDDEHLSKLSEMIDRLPDRPFSSWRHGSRCLSLNGKHLIVAEERNVDEEGPWTNYAPDTYKPLWRRRGWTSEPGRRQIIR